ncbi:MAG: hypothetical protein AVDCRST_MAG73-481 [uncultured Thermomicrobiales bacterium]|uniref:N-acetyltransferase domain-containing protein n=1 Tax=uncultured Thermomicrobiales bacterium TaxID=1645740 RepID=A0A6J4TM02_9BACT|nr:MAG: hypothetical protein AVDCRST_MAG73-481 [uncultured Thermomicrobiales bacterium]
MTSPIRTPRLVLRDHVRDDWEAIHRITSDPAVSRFMNWGPNTPEDTTRFLDAVLASAAEVPRHDHNWAVALAADGRLVGNCVLRVHDPAQETAFIGYALDRAVWGHGFGTEVAVGLLDFGFAVLGLRRIVASCDARNLASARVLEKAGLRHEGRLLQERFQKGEWRDTLLFAILRDEWRGHSPPDATRREAAG